MKRTIAEHWDPDEIMTADSDPHTEYNRWREVAKCYPYEWAGNEFTLSDFEAYISGLRKTTPTVSHEWEKLSDYLKRKSKDICEDNECTDDEHHCGSFAYVTITCDGEPCLLGICLPDYFGGSSKPCAAIPLPWDGDSEGIV